MLFSIITPVFNGERFIREAIESILSQKGDFKIEYIVMDGGSTDSTVNIAQSYEEKLRNGTHPIACNGISMRVFSEKDRGMYDAINKGFARAEGDIFAWLNSDDVYLPGALTAVQNVFTTSPDTQWLKGISSVIAEDGTPVGKPGKYIHYRQKWIACGIYGRYAPFIQQESVFWRKDLWQKVAPIDVTLRNAGDYWLWIHMAELTPLYSLNFPIAYFRHVDSSLTNHDGGTNYRREQTLIMPPQGTLLEFSIKLFYWTKNKLSL